MTRLGTAAVTAALFGGALTLANPSVEQAADWPRSQAQWTLDIFKSKGTQPDDLIGWS